MAPLYEHYGRDALFALLKPRLELFSMPKHPCKSRGSPHYETHTL